MDDATQGDQGTGTSARATAADDPQAGANAAGGSVEERLRLIGLQPLETRAASFAEVHDTLRDQLEQSDAMNADD